MDAPARRTAPVLLSVAAVGLALDQSSKALVLSRMSEGESVAVLGRFLHFTLQRNPGAAFSLFQRIPVAFTVLAFAISIAILIGLPRVKDRPHAVALGLVLAGALGNLADRVFRPPGPFRGHVIDFIDFRVWPVFNVADSCIVIGALLLIVASWRADKAKARAGAATPDAAPEPEAAHANDDSRSHEADASD